MYMSPDEFPLPYEYRDLTFEGLLGAPPDGHRGAGGGVPRLRQHRPHAGRLPPAATGTHIVNIDHHHDNTRFGTVNLVDAEASCTAEIVFGIAQALGARDHAVDRRRAVRGPGHRHRPLHVREHHAGCAPDGRRPDRGRRRAPPRLPPPLRGPAVPPPPAALAGARRASSATTTARSRWHSSRGRTTRTRARSRRTPRASSTTCGRSRAPRSRCSCASCWPTIAAAAARSACARPTAASTSPQIARALGGGGHRQAAGATTELAPDELVEKIRAEVAAQLHPA